MGASLTQVDVKGISESSWAIDHLRLTEGYWVLLVDNEKIADELARRLVGLDAPSTGRILLNGNEPFRSPATRAGCVIVQRSEARAPAVLVRDSLARQACLLGTEPDSLGSLKSFGIEHLLNRSHDSLSAQERRQVAFARATARHRVELAVFCEPRLDLSAMQLARLQDHISQLAARGCVLCITASLHDARQLGGPHAQLTRSGWSWVIGQGPGSNFQLLVEGTGLRPLAADLALQRQVTQVRLQIDEGDREVLHASAISDVTTQLMRVARQNRANVFRICLDESLAPADATASEPTAPAHGAREIPVAGHGQDCNLVRMVWSGQRERLTKTLRSQGALLVLAGPFITALYAAAQRQLSTAYALQNTLSFLITYIVPLGALFSVRILRAESALGALCEPFAVLGVNRRLIVIANLVVVSVTCAAIAAAGGAAAVLLTTGVSVDLGVCAWIAALGAAAYVSIFVLIDQLRYRWLPWVYLITDIGLGASALGLSALFPHAHLLNLLGSPGALDLAQPVSVLCLSALIALASGLMVWRTAP